MGTWTRSGLKCLITLVACVHLITMTLGLWVFFFLFIPKNWSNYFCRRQTLSLHSCIFHLIHKQENTACFKFRQYVPEAGDPLRNEWMSNEGKRWETLQKQATGILKINKIRKGGPPVVVLPGHGVPQPEPILPTCSLWAVHLPAEQN